MGIQSPTEKALDKRVAEQGLPDISAPAPLSSLEVRYLARRVGRRKPRKVSPE